MHVNFEKIVFANMNAHWVYDSAPPNTKNELHRPYALFMQT